VVVVSVFVAVPAGVSTRVVDFSVLAEDGLLVSTFTLVDELGSAGFVLSTFTLVDELGAGAVAESCTTVLVSFSFTTGSFTTVVVVPAEPLVVAG